MRGGLVVVEVEKCELNIYCEPSHDCVWGVFGPGTEEIRRGVISCA